MKEFIKVNQKLIKSTDVPCCYVREGNIDFMILKQVELDQTGFKEKVYKCIIQDEKLYQWITGLEFSEAKDPKEVKKMIDVCIKSSLRFLSKLDLAIEKMEDEVFQGRSLKNFKEKWYHLKDSLQFIERNLRRIHNVMKSFSFESEFYKKSDLEVNAELEMADFQLRNIENLGKKLSSLEQYYGLVKAEKMNKNIYVLTIASGLFLPLNLIVGFFGMNTSNLFFQNHPQGTFQVIYILLGIVGVFVLALPAYFTILRFIRINSKIKNYLIKNLLK